MITSPQHLILFFFSDPLGMMLLMVAFLYAEYVLAKSILKDKTQAQLLEFVVNFVKNLKNLRPEAILVPIKLVRATRKSKKAIAIK